MRRLDDTPLDPEIEATLDAIDATLAGEPVDPRFAEIAELALLLADDRPVPRPAFADQLDARVERRFAPSPAVTEWFGRSPASRRRKPWWSWVGEGAVGTAFVAGLVGLVFLVANTGGGASSSSSYSAATTSASTSASSSSGAMSIAPTSHSASASGGAAQALRAHSHSEALTKSPATNKAIAGARSFGTNYSYSAHAPVAAGLVPTVAPNPNGRAIVQSAEVDLATAPDKIDAVAQEVFNVVGSAGGIVDHSSVTQTGGMDGYANFQLRIPSGALAQTLTRLSQVAGASVVARTDNTQDVNSQWVSAQRQLADDKALRAALLKQLAAATTTGEIDSLNARIHDAEGAIASDEANINSLSAQINYSKVVVTINARPVPPPPVHHSSSGGLTLGHSAHIAGRVLVVAAGIALIVLAGLVPVGLLAALGAWIAVTVRRRRREQALDMA